MAKFDDASEEVFAKVAKIFDEVFSKPPPFLTPKPDSEPDTSKLAGGE